MAKPSGVSFADLISSQEKNNLKMNASIASQLKAHQTTEKVLKDTQKLQAIETMESVASRRDEDKMVVELKKGLLDKTGDGLNSNMIKLLKTAKDSMKLMVDSKKVLEKSKEVKEFKSISQRIGGVKEGVKDFFTMRGFLDKTGIVKRGGTGMMATRLDAGEDASKRARARIATGERARDEKTGRILGGEASLKIFKQDEVKKQGLRRQQGDLERTVEGYKKSGLSEKQISQTPEGKALLKLAETFAKLDPISFSGKDKPGHGEKDGRIKAGPKAPNVDTSEADLEQQKILNDQTGLLDKIEQNTRKGEGLAKPTEGGDTGGGGILAGLGKGLGGLGAGIGKGIGGILSGIGTGLLQLSVGLISLTPAIPIIAVLTLAAIGLGAALRIAAPAIEAFAPVLIKVADVIGTVFIEAIKAIPAVLGAIGNVITTIGNAISSVIDSVTTSIERLGKIDGSNLLSVGAGLMAVAAGLVAFSGAQAVAGVGNLVSGFLGAVTGQKTPIEQLQELAAVGPNLNQAGTGVKNVAEGLAKFSAIDPDKIKAISALPTDKIIAMGTAMGKANQVYNQSGQNAGAAQPNNKQAAGPVVVSAPTTVNKSSDHAYIKTSTRNNESSLNSYYKSRFAN